MYDPDTGTRQVSLYNLLHANQLMELHYMRTLLRSNVLLVLKLNDSSSGILGGLMGMEPIDISWSDRDGNVITYSMVVYDITRSYGHRW